MGTLLSCEHVSLSYDGLRHAVADLNFTVEAGRILVDGLDARRDSEGVRRRLGYLPDNFALYDQMTPVEYLEFFARAYGVERRAWHQRIDGLLEEFDLTGKRSSAIRTLSRGMRQRLGVAKTLVHDPKVVLLDEPASALDPGARLKLRDALLRLKRRGLAVLISSHILPDLAGLADAVGIMEGGRMLHFGALDTV